MKKYSLILLSATLAAAALLWAQQPQGTVKIKSGEGKPVIAIPDFRGAGEAQRSMGAFNETLWNEVQQSGLFKMSSKSFYPVRIPQQPADFKSGGSALTEWSNPPVNAQWLAYGYTAVQGGQLVLYGWLYNVQSDLSGAQVIGKLYFGTLDEAGTRKVAREFAADILKQFGAASLIGTKIYFVSDRTRNKEIWRMDYDGSNQEQVTHYGSISTYPCVSSDGSKIAFTTWYQGQPKIFVHSAESKRKLPFYNPVASFNAPSDFSPDGKQLLFYSSTDGKESQIYLSAVDGSNMRPISSSRAIEVEPKINPKNPSELVFVSGRSGLPQIYRMNIDGADTVRLSNGEGEAVNPSWHPNGQQIAFAWTKGFEPGNYNIFVMDVADHSIVQLTSASGRNENPVWAPDGAHIVFSSKRGRGTQIYTMLADGTQVKQLTNQGNNEKAVWAKGIN